MRKSNLKGGVKNQIYKQNKSKKQKMEHKIIPQHDIEEVNRVHKASKSK